MIVFLSVITVGAFMLKQSTPSIETLQDKFSLVIGLYKAEKDEKEYFSALIKALEAKEISALFNPRFKYYSDLEELCDDMLDGKVDIAGELSPIEYVKNYRAYKFKPFLGIEYDGRAFYHAVFFAPNDATLFIHHFEEKPGHDNLKLVKSLLEDLKYDAKILFLGKKSSTSGYYYPRSYFIDQKIRFAWTKAFNNHENIYKEVLKKDGKQDLKNSEAKRYIAGFLADFRLKYYKDKYCKETNCYEPLIIDKSDPIPNGVFVISNAAANKNEAQMEEIVRIWKTVRPVQVGGDKGPKITSWRTGVERDLDLVEYHKDKVDYYKLYKQNYSVWLATTIAVLVIVLSVISYAYMRRV